MSGYGVVDTLSCVSLEREAFSNPGGFFLGDFGSHPSPSLGIRKVKENSKREREKKKKKWGWGWWWPKDVLKGRKEKKTYSFHLVVASLSIALPGKNDCPSTPPSRGRCVVLAVASVPTGHCWD